MILIWQSTCIACNRTDSQPLFIFQCIYGKLRLFGPWGNLDRPYISIQNPEFNKILKDRPRLSTHTYSSRYNFFIYLYYEDRSCTTMFIIIMVLCKLLASRLQDQGSSLTSTYLNRRATYMSGGYEWRVRITPVICWLLFLILCARVLCRYYGMHLVEYEILYK